MGDDELGLEIEELVADDEVDSAVGDNRPPDEELPEVTGELEGEQEAASLDDDEGRLLPAAEAEYQRLIGLGLPDSAELQEQAWEYARQQDSYLREAIAQGVEAQLAPYTAALAPAIYTRDVAAVLSESPVHGVSAEELAGQIAQSGIPAQEWMNADPRQRELFVVTAARQLAYEKFVRGELSPAGTLPVAPAQSAPGVLGRGQGAKAGRDPAFERDVEHLAETMGLSRKAAEEVLTG